MSARDRMVLIVVAAVAVLGAAYLMVLSPERKKATEVQAKVETARTQLSEAQSKLASATEDERRYSAAYASIVSLGQAVPADQEVPSLVYELDHATAKDQVSFESITSGGSASGSSSSSSSSTSSASAGASVASAGFQQLPFTFSFKGTYEQLYKLMGRLQGFTISMPDGSVQVRGRLLSIQGLTLASGGASGGSSSGPAGGSSEDLTATVTATAYVLPPGQSLTGGASASGPSAASATGSGGSSGTGPTTTPAVVRPLP